MAADHQPTACMVCASVYQLMRFSQCAVCWFGWFVCGRVPAGALPAVNHYAKTAVPPPSLSRPNAFVGWSTPAAPLLATPLVRSSPMSRRRRAAALPVRAPLAMRLLSLLLLAAPSSCAAARTTAPPLAFSRTFGNGMVLALDRATGDAVVWGTTAPGATVATSVPAATPATYSTTAGTDGVWRQRISGLKEGLDPINITASSSAVAASPSSPSSSAVLDGVLVGKVLLCSGQSNIETITVARAFNATAELAACGAFPYLRLARVADDKVLSGPQADLSQPLAQPWAAPTAAGCAPFSATCFFAARDLFLELGGDVPVGVVESAVGGTAVRGWVPEAALARCSQPWSGEQHYGFNPYTHSGLFNAMVSAFGTGPTPLTAVLWDQAESDSFPQTLPGYYGCETVAHVASWRDWFGDALLPWVFVHLQPYTGSESGASTVEQACGALYGNPLAELRHAQLTALMLPRVGYASAMDLGDPTSPFGDVHFQNKQVVARRAVAAALRVAFDRANALQYPPPQFLHQVPDAPGAGGCAMTVSFGAVQAAAAGAGGPARTTVPASPLVVFGSTPDPATAGNSATCPTAVPGAPRFNCTGFALLCTTPEIPHNASNPAAWVPAVAALAPDGRSVRLTPASPVNATAGLVARGSRYAWGEWPLATLFAADGGLPILPWNQALTCTNGTFGSPC